MFMEDNRVDPVQMREGRGKTAPLLSLLPSSVGVREREGRVEVIHAFTIADSLCIHPT